MSKQIDQMMDEIKGLKGHVLSVYLNTNPDSEDWKILLKNGLKRTTEYIQASNPEQIKEFQKICKQVDQTIKDNQTSFLNSLACFASSEQLYIYHLQIPVQNDFTNRKSTRLNSSHVAISYAVFCLKKKNGSQTPQDATTCGVNGMK